MTLAKVFFHQEYPQHFETQTLCVENVFRYNSKKQQRWVRAKRQMPGCLVLVRVGRFYHCFHHDAEVLHSLGKQYGEGYIAVCAFPFTELGLMMKLLRQHTLVII